MSDLTQESNKLSLPMVVLILNGWGIAPETKGNILSSVVKPNFDWLAAQYPSFVLQTSAGGIEKGCRSAYYQIGHSRPFLKQSDILDEFISEELLYKNKALLDTLKKNKKTKANLHVFLEQGSVASLSAAMQIKELLIRKKLPPMKLHLSMSGNLDLDVCDYDALFEGVDVCSYAGKKYYSNDNGNFADIKVAYEAVTRGLAKTTQDILKNIKEADNSSEPCVLVDKYGQPKAEINKDDMVIFLSDQKNNFAALAECLSVVNFSCFERNKLVYSADYFSLLPLSQKLPVKQLLEKTETATLLEVLEGQCKQCLITDSRHTYDANQLLGKAQVERVVISGAITDNFSEADEEIEELIIKALKDDYKLIIANLGSAEAAAAVGNVDLLKQAISIQDEIIGRLAKQILSFGGTLVVFGDHGHLEDYIDYKLDRINFVSSNNPVPLIVVSEKLSGISGYTESVDNDFSLHKSNDSLLDLAPTIISVFGLEIPVEFLGKNLLNK